ncbi:MAG: BlaI/MecI/CopY family transcriptional regulator [Parachlamydiales bacterium]|nr:BlaI/MecI/CopY family transcriptional regulator [Parachlamydiales bacterium]
MGKKRQFGELESLILELVKNKKKASVLDIHKKMEEKVAYTTIMTVMSRLYEKGYLNRERTGKSYIYWVSANNKDNFIKILDRMKSKFFFGKSMQLVSYLIENDQTITKEEIEKIENLIKNAKEKL